MPTLDRTHDPARPTTAPRIPFPRDGMSLPARVRHLVTPSRRSRAWPATLALLALIMFIMFWAQTTLLTALVAALATVVAGGFLLTLMFGPGWITRMRLLPQGLRRHR
jgi:hypothetical protein